MATEEKLKYFYDSTMTALQKKNDDELDLMRERLAVELEDYKKNHGKEIDDQERLHEAEIKRELLKQVAGEKLAIRREQSRREGAIKDKLFTEVGEIMDAYRKTPAYFETLVSIIEKIVSFSQGDEVIIYMCESDAHLKKELEEKCEVSLEVSDVPFNGGIQAEIPSRNIFINNSFSSEIAEAKSEYIVRP